jgi:hypothetical protein
MNVNDNSRARKRHGKARQKIIIIIIIIMQQQTDR